MHSSSRLAYDLPDEYHALQAELAIDQLAGRSGSVIYRVYLQDRAGQWSKAFESGVVRGGQQPVPMRVDVRSAARYRVDRRLRRSGRPTGSCQLAQCAFGALSPTPRIDRTVRRFTTQAVAVCIVGRFALKWTTIVDRPLG